MCKENNNNIIYSAVLLPKLPSSAILVSNPEGNQPVRDFAEHNQRSLRLVALRFHQKYLNLCSDDKRRFYWFGTT